MIMMFSFKKPQVGMAFISISSFFIFCSQLASDILLFDILSLSVKENYEILGYDIGFIESIQDIFIEMYSSLI